MKRFLVCSYLVITHFASVFSQNIDIVKTAGIAPGLHSDNIGKIFFTSRNIPVAELKRTDFLRTYLLTNKSNLSFVAFLGNSVTNYLHRLDPGVPADSLVKAGNYQFSLYIDDKLVYQSNLYPGAPYAKIQDSATVIDKPLIDNVNGYGLWTESYWNRFMANGGDSALSDGRHLLRMEIRTYLKTNILKVSELIASGELRLDVLRKPVINIANIHLSPIKAYDGFGVSTGKFDSNKIRELKGNIEAGIFKKISSIIVIRNGRILIEEYFNGATRQTLHDPRSVGKSFASTITGIAIHEHYLQSEDQNIKDFYDLHTFKNYSRIKDSVTIRDLLTMRSAFDGNDEDLSSPGNEENMYPTEDWVKFTLDLPVRPDTASKTWHYFTAGVILLGDVLTKAVPGGLEKYANDKLFHPLGIKRYRWEYTPQKVPNTAGGIKMCALDFAKYGQLYKDGGNWKGKQLIPADWVKKSFTRQVKIIDRKDEYYGYLFWNKAFSSNQQGFEAYYCAGNGGNYIIVFKDQPLVVVVTSTAYGQSYAHPQVNKIISEYILPAVAR